MNKSRGIFHDIQGKIAISTFYDRVNQIYRDYGPMKKEIARYVIVDQLGLDLNDYDVSSEDLQEVRRIKTLIRESNAGSNIPENKRKQQKSPKATVNRQVTIHLTHQFTLTDPILPPAKLAEAEMMSKGIYSFFYVLENSLRELILKVMNNAYGKNQWWDKTHIPADIYKRAEERKNNEKKEPWHGKRGHNVHSIYYTDFMDLPTIIINKKNWSHFKDVISNKESFHRRLHEISLSRNIVMHCNPLSDQDKKRLEVYFEDWQNVLKENLNLIPQ